MTNTQNTQRYFYEPTNTDNNVSRSNPANAVKLLFKTSSGRLMESKPFTAFADVINCKRIQINNGLIFVKAVTVKRF